MSASTELNARLFDLLISEAGTARLDGKILCLGFRDDFNDTISLVVAGFRDRTQDGDGQGRFAIRKATIVVARPPA